MNHTFDNLYEDTGDFPMEFRIDWEQDDDATYDEEGNLEIILCAASAYTQKYYLNEDFSSLPAQVQNELQILCVLFTEDVGGTIRLGFHEDGSLFIRTEAHEEDILYDEIGSCLKVRQMQREKKELFEALETFFRVFWLGEEILP